MESFNPSVLDTRANQKECHVEFFGCLHAKP